jgi:carboxyl-terminal processing protease
MASWQIIVVAVLLLSSRWSGAAQPRDSRPQDMFSLLDLFAACITIVESEYVDEINPTNLVYGALHGMMRALDPHSEFMEPAETEELKVETEGEFGGIGIEIGIRDDYLTVIAPIEDTPAAAAGIMPLDRFLKIGDENARMMTISDAVKRLRGKPGTTVAITIQRTLGERREIKEFTLTRAVIKVKRVRDAALLDTTNRIGYVRVTAFDKTTASELQEAIEGLVTQGMWALVLDLRNNGGGLLVEAIKMADLFLDTNAVIVSVRGRAPLKEQVFRATGNGTRFAFPLAVLVNGASASASEIVTGAIKDNHRGLIIGDRTFGKGSVQTVLPVGNNDCSLRLTTAKYFTPSGVCIHGTGIYPHILAPLSLEDEIRLIEKRSTLYKKLDPASLTKEERVRYENLRNVRDVPLERAIDILTALRMLGAEGITRFLQAMPTNELDAATAAVPANVSTETVDEIEH